MHYRIFDSSNTHTIPEKKQFFVSPEKFYFQRYASLIGEIRKFELKATMYYSVYYSSSVKLGSDDARTYAQTLKQAILGTPDAQIAVCIVGNNKKDRYDAIKKICCLENPIPSQVSFIKIKV